VTLVASAHEGMVEAAGVVVQCREGPALRAGVAPGERVVGVAAHPFHPVVVAPVGDRDDDPHMALQTRQNETCS